MEAYLDRQGLTQAFVDLDDEATLGEVEAQLEAGSDPLAVIEKCRLGITEVGERFASGEYYLSELIMAADIFQRAMALIEPHLNVAAGGDARSSVVMGTVKGDIHDLGKNIVVILLRCEGFEVLDLGVDVPPERFVTALLEAEAPVVGMSCLMTTAFESMKATVQAIEEAGIRERVYVMIGGGPVDERVCEHVGADLFARDAVEGIRACKRWLDQLTRS
jgi:methylmalonyl-CoA mutase cobalamin-binding domain/chain